LAPITMKYKTGLFEEGEDPQLSNNILEIRNGKFMRGQLDKSTLGSTTKGIIHRICNDFGNLHASNFIDDLQNVVTEYMKTSAFSVGISDLVSNKNTSDISKNVRTINQLFLEINGYKLTEKLETYKTFKTRWDIMNFLNKYHVNFRVWTIDDIEEIEQSSKKSKRSNSMDC